MVIIYGRKICYNAKHFSLKAMSHSFFFCVAFNVQASFKRIVFWFIISVDNIITFKWTKKKK